MMAVDSGLNSCGSSSSSSSSCSNNQTNNNIIDECPLCLEILDIDDKSFFPCTCGYQICRFCWHRILSETSDESKGCCPACRKPYTENPANFKPLSVEDVQQKLKAQKRQKDQLKKQKTVDSRRHLADLRVVQKNLVFVVGITPRIADPELLKKNEYFGRFGKIHKIVVNNVAANTVPTSTQATPTIAYGAYITYNKSDDALRAIQSVNNIPFDGKTIKASLGTTKYCSHFMRNQSCPKPECMYLHHHGDPDASFTKEDMQAGKHQEYEKRLIEEFNLFQIIQQQQQIKLKQDVVKKIVTQRPPEVESPPITEITEQPQLIPVSPPPPQLQIVHQIPHEILEEPILQQNGVQNGLQNGHMLEPHNHHHNYSEELSDEVLKENSELGFDPFSETQQAFEKIIQDEVLNGFTLQQRVHQQQQQSQSYNIQSQQSYYYPTHQNSSHPPGFNPWQQTHQSNTQLLQDDNNWMNLDPAIIFSSPTTTTTREEEHLLGNDLLNDVFNNFSISQPQILQQQQRHPGHTVGPPLHQIHQQQQHNIPIQPYSNSPPLPINYQQQQKPQMMTSPPPGFSQQQQPFLQQHNNNNFFYHNQFPF